MSFSWKYDKYSGQEYQRPFMERAAIVLSVGGLAIAGILGVRSYMGKENQVGGIGPSNLPTSVAAAPNLGGPEPFPGGITCSVEKSTVIVDDRSIVDGRYSMYRAINVNFGEESEIGIPGGEPIQGTPTEAFVLKVAEESSIAVTDVNNVPKGNYQVRSICNGPGTSWNANSTAA